MELCENSVKLCEKCVRFARQRVPTPKLTLFVPSVKSKIAPWVKTEKLPRAQIDQGPHSLCILPWPRLRHPFSSISHIVALAAASAPAAVAKAAAAAIITILGDVGSVFFG